VSENSNVFRDAFPTEVGFTDTSWNPPVPAKVDATAARSNYWEMLAVSTPIRRTRRSMHWADIDRIGYGSPARPSVRRENASENDTNSDRSEERRSGLARNVKVHLEVWLQFNRPGHLSAPVNFHAMFFVN
jgi:hypothetical protein